MSLPSPLPLPCAALDSAKLPVQGPAMFTLTQPPFCILYQCIVGHWNAIITVLYSGFHTPSLIPRLISSFRARERAWVRGYHTPTCNTVHKQQQLRLAACSDRDFRSYFNCD